MQEAANAQKNSLSNGEIRCNIHFQSSWSVLEMWEETKKSSLS